MEVEKKRFWTYENRMMLVLCLAFGFVFFDRFAVGNLAIYILPDLKMNNADLGLVTAIFGVTWSVIGLVGGAISDRFKSPKKLLTIFVIAFSLCSFLTGLATGLVMLLVIRAVMGATEGPIMPIAPSFILLQSSPHRRAMNMGLFQVTCTAIIATLLGPIVQVALAQSIGWRWTFIITIIPGLIIAFFIYRVLINPDTEKIAKEEKLKEKVKLSEVLFRRNVLLSIFGCVFLICWYICTMTFAPSYLVTEKGLTPTEMSIVVGAFGLGSALWGILLPRLSDTFGRRPLVMIGAAMGFFCTLGLYLAPKNMLLLIIIAFVGFGGQSVTVMMLTTVPAESGDPRYVSTIIGTTQLFGEMVGASVGAIIFGIVADKYSLGTVMLSLSALMIVVFIVGILYKESAPLVLQRRAQKLGSIQSEKQLVNK